MKKRNGINIDDELENIIDTLDGRNADELVVIADHIYVLLDDESIAFYASFTEYLANYIDRLDKRAIDFIWSSLFGNPNPIGLYWDDPCYQDDEKDLGLQYADEETLIKIITKRIKKFVNSREFNEKTFKEIVDYLRNY